MIGDYSKLESTRKPRLLSAVYACGKKMFLYIVIVASIIISWLLRPKLENLPPGPWGLPLLGYLPFIDQKPYKTFRKLGEKYGKIFSLYIGNHLVVCIQSYELIREAYLKHGTDFDGRPEHEMYKNDEETNFFFSESTMWAEFRRFGTTVLRDFGMGKTALEPMIHDELRQLTTILKTFEGKVTDFRFLLSMACNNIFHIIVFGHRFDYNDTKHAQFCHQLQNYISTFRTVLYKYFNPLNVQRLKEKLGIVNGKQDTHPFFDILLEFIDEDLQNAHPNEAKNFINTWMEECNKRDLKDGKYLTKDHLKVFLSSIYVGSETMSNSLQWSIMHLMEHSDVQRRFQKEIDDVVGFERTPMLNDKSNLSYVEATLLECDRVISVTPMILNHKATKSTKLGGYDIPKETVIMASAWSTHNDPETFQNPQWFDPNRFLNAEQKFIKFPQIIPFSIGRRLCPGKIISEMVLYLTMTTLLQQFTFNIPEGQKLRFDSKPGTQHVPYPFEVILKSRDDLKM